MTAPKTFDFPYQMVKSACTKCGAAHETIDGGSLRAARLVRGVTLRELARRIGFSAAYLSDVETNRRAVTPKVLGFYKLWLA